MWDVLTVDPGKDTLHWLVDYYNVVKSTVSEFKGIYAVQTRTFMDRHENRFTLEMKHH